MEVRIEEGDQACDEEVTEISTLSGSLRCMSPPLLCKDGKLQLGFLCIFDVNKQCKQFVLYTVSAFSEWRRQLVVSKSYTITNLTRAGKIDWFYATKKHGCQLSLLSDEDVPKRMKMQSIRFMEIGAKLFRDVNILDYLTPPQIGMKNDYEGTEICVEGVFQRYHQASGYLEFLFEGRHAASSSDSRSSYDHDEVTIGIYLTDYPLAAMESISHLQPRRCVVRASAVLPMYLWGKLHGFATTIRSHIEIVPLHEQKNAKRTRHSPVESPGALVCERCSLFSVWRSFISNKLSYCTVDMNSTQLDTVWGCIYGDTNVLSTTKFASSPGSSPSSPPHGDTTFLLPHFSQYKKVNNEILPPLQHQFADIHYLQLYKIRNGHDSDLLMTHFAYVLSVGNVVSYIRSSEAYAALLDTSSVYDNKFYPAVLMGCFCDRIEKYYLSTQLHCRCMLVGTCSSQRVFHYRRTCDLGGGRPRVFLLFELTDALDNSIRCIVSDFKGLCDASPLCPSSEGYDQDAVAVIGKFSVYLEKGCQLPAQWGAMGGVSDVSLTPYLLVDPSDITFIYSKKSGGEVVSSNAKETMIIPDTSNVRWVLASNAKPNHILKGVGSHEVCGVVVGKEIAVEQSNGKRQLSLQLKDCVHSDVITVYFTHCYDYSTSNILIGAVVRITNVFINATAKYTYVKTSVTSEVDIIGMASTEQMKVGITIPFHNCNGAVDAVVMSAAADSAMHSNTAAYNAISTGTTSATSTIPPNNLLCNLQTSNKTLWRFIGSVSLIKYIKCVMRCNCSDRAIISVTNSVLRCSSCNSNKNLRCVWTIQSVLDDGSAEAKMNVEGTGKHVFSILCQANGGRDVLEAVIGRVESYVREHCDGYGFYMRTFVENSFFTANDNSNNNNNNNSNNNNSNNNNNNGNSNSNNSNNDKSKQRAYDDMKAEVMHVLKACSFPTLQVVGRCIVGGGAAAAPAVPSSGGVQRKQISLQWNNSDQGKLHSLQFKKVDSFAAPVVTIETTRVERLVADDDVYAETTKQLALIMGKFDLH